MALYDTYGLNKLARLRSDQIQRAQDAAEILPEVDFPYDVNPFSMDLWQTTVDQSGLTKPK